MTKQLPPVKTLLSDSWTLFSKNIVAFLVFQLFFPIVALLAVGIPAGLLAFFTYKIPFMFVTVIIIAVVLLVALMIASSNALILSLWDEKKGRYGDYFRKGWSLVLPVLGMSIFVGVLTAGAFFLFVIPALIVGLFLMFWSYEIIVQRSGAKKALISSATIFKQHSWKIIGRILLVWGIIYGIILLISAFGQENAATGVLIQIVSTVTGWFALAYSITLYKQARDITDFEKQAKITWIYAVSIAGWVLFIIAMASFGAFVSQQLQNNPVMKQVQTKTT